MKSFIAQDLLDSSAEVIYCRLKNDKTLPDMLDYEEIQKNPDLIPSELRVFDLVFPHVVFRGLSEGGDKVTDDSIGMLIWDGKKWQSKHLLAGKDGWRCTGPDECGPRARLIRYST